MSFHLVSLYPSALRKGGKTKLSSNTTTNNGLSVEQVLQENYKLFKGRKGRPLKRKP